MALVWKDKVAELSTTTGTGAFTLAGAISAGYRTFGSVLSVGDIIYYVITAVNGGVPTGDWESGLGTYSGANTLTRTTVLDSSNAGAAVSFGAGTKRVTITQIAAAVQEHTTPLAADFTTERNGTGMTAATIADLTDSPGVVMTFSRNSTAGNWRQSYLLRDAPAAPFRAEARIINPQQSTNDFFMAGLAISTTNGSDVGNHIRILDLYSSSTHYFPYSSKCTGLNAQEVALTTINNPTQLIKTGTEIWCAIEWDGSNINTYASFDGYTWWKHGVEPDTFFVGDPDLVGFGWEAVASDNGTQYVWCPHFVVTTNLADPLGLNRYG